MGGAMNAKLTDANVTVTLSLRNVHDMLRAFERGNDSTLIRTTEAGITLRVSIESNEKHYAERRPGPGIGQ